MEDCARMSCDKVAVALLTFAPQEARAWLHDLIEPDPTGGIMLCRRHANATVVPMSWQLIDGRDPAWPGPASGDVPAEDESHEDDLIDLTATVDERLAAALPSDAGLDREFAALDGALPVTPQPYREPREATERAAGVVAGLESERAADMSLFELPLADLPAVTPHPDFT